MEHLTDDPCVAVCKMEAAARFLASVFYYAGLVGLSLNGKRDGAGEAEGAGALLALLAARTATFARQDDADEALSDAEWSFSLLAEFFRDREDNYAHGGHCLAAAAILRNAADKLNAALGPVEEGMRQAAAEGHPAQ